MCGNLSFAIAAYNFLYLYRLGATWNTVTRTIWVINTIDILPQPQRHCILFLLAMIFSTQRSQQRFDYFSFLFFFSIFIRYFWFTVKNDEADKKNCYKTKKRKKYLKRLKNQRTDRMQEAAATKKKQNYYILATLSTTSTTMTQWLRECERQKNGSHQKIKLKIQTDYQFTTDCYAETETPPYSRDILGYACERTLVSEIHVTQ